MNLTEENYHELERCIDKKIALLEHHGWKALTTGEFFDPVSQATYSFPDALDKLHYRIVKEKNWKSVAIAVHHDKLPECREQGVFQSPHTGKLYTWFETVRIVLEEEKEDALKPLKFSLDISEQIPQPVDSEYSYHFKFTRNRDSVRYVYLGKTFDYYRPMRIEAAKGK